MEKAAWADVLTIKTNEQALTNSIIASVVNARINIAIAQRRLALAIENIDSQEQTLEIVQRRYDPKQEIQTYRSLPIVYDRYGGEK